MCVAYLGAVALGPIGQFYNFEVAERAVVDGEAYEGAHFMESVDACSTGIDM